MGPKGHTFVVVPYKSESYSNQVIEFLIKICLIFFSIKNDPIDKDVPYCNVKSFPANIEHCTIWAREKVMKKTKKKYFLFFLNTKNYEFSLKVLLI